MEVRPAIKELRDNDLKQLLKVMLNEGNPNDPSDSKFVKELCHEIANREKGGNNGDHTT